eukprot:g339.t1
MLVFLLFFVLFLNFGLYFIGQLLIAFVFKEQNLRVKYGAKWALVTGASSGIGKSLAWKCAEQGLNVVLVAIPDSILDQTTEELNSAFPSLQFRKIGVDLSDQQYLETIQKVTEDIEIQLLFCNAGYLVTGLFHDTTLKRQLDNLNCNATSAVAITHHFITKLVTKKLKGGVVLTSSPAGCMPGPFASMYAATKSFLSMFGASIAPEVKSHGIDVLIFHPSPIASRFYQNQKKIDLLDFFKSFARSPDGLPQQVFSCLGRTTWADFGLTATCFRVINKMIDFNFLTTFLTSIAHLLPDYKRQNKS